MARTMAFAVTAWMVANLAWSTGSSAADLIVKISGFRNSDGVVRYSLFSNAEGFPGDAAKAVQKGEAPVREKAAEFKVSNLIAGPYALSLIHDENKNDKLDTGLFGIPTEGVGASNNAKGSFGPPKFDDAKFELGEKGGVQEIKVQYIF
jgi:uncharacterized protein (DUF2141 family)